MTRNYSNNSIKSKIIRLMIKMSNFKKTTSSIENVKKYINWCSHKKISEKIFDGMKKENYKEYTFYKYDTKDENDESVLIYIHGGSFVDKPLNIQVKFAKKVAKKINSSLIIPLYKTIPEGNAQIFFEEMIQIYNYMLGKYKKVYLMGDSAGGGAVLSLSLLLNDLNIKSPDSIIMLSPWLDLTLKNKNIVNKKDIVCSEIGNRYCGSLWADKYDINDYRISPINGNFSHLNKVFILCGGNEICQPDCVEAVRKLEKNEVDFEFVQFDNQFHNFELYPIPESKLVINEIYNYVVGGLKNDK